MYFKNNVLIVTYHITRIVLAVKEKIFMHIYFNKVEIRIILTKIYDLESSKK